MFFFLIFITKISQSKKHKFIKCHGSAYGFAKKKTKLFQNKEFNDTTFLLDFFYLFVYAFNDIGA